jgi:hypothetical protein
MYDNVLPIFRLFGQERQFEWHENTEPGTHNYEVDNRQQSYRFFSQHFGLPITTSEIPVEGQLHTPEQLAVGLPTNNLTILGLARKLAREIKRDSAPEDARARAQWAAATRLRLKALLRYHPPAVVHPWMLGNTKAHGLETLSYRFELSDGLSAAGVWLKAATTPPNAPAIVVLDDRGKRAAADAVAAALNRGEQVLALDLLLTSDAAPDSPWEYSALLATTGERPLGIEAGQLIAIANWLRQVSAPAKVRLEATGIRSQAVAQVTSALEPTLFPDVVVRSGMESFSHLLEAAVPYRQSPDLFCLDFYREFDVQILRALAAAGRADKPGQ